MSEAEDDGRRDLMRYRRLTKELSDLDPKYLKVLTSHYFPQIKKHGMLLKRQEGFFGTW